MSTENKESETTDKVIFCPFLRTYKPGTSSLWEFVSDLHDKGRLDRAAGLLIGGDVTSKQQGLWKALTGSAPDLYKLDQVPGISHADLFQKHVDKLDKTADKDGSLTIQNLVDIKKEIAEEEGCDEIIKSSRIETALLFLGSGGDMETGKVRLVDIKAFLSGTSIESQPDITFDTVKKATKMCSW